MRRFGLTVARTDEAKIAYEREATLKIRKTMEKDLDEVMKIYADARDFMRESGNPNQWFDVHPARAVVENDIKVGTSYVCESENGIAAVFYYNIERDPTYTRIDGAWQNDDPYGVIHRIARRKDATGAGAYCLNWAFEQCGNLRIDTHRDNIPMRGLVEKLGFRYCGIIWIESGDERMAFQKLKSKG